MARQSVTIQERSQCNLRTVLKHSKTHKRTFQRQNSRSKQEIVYITSRNLVLKSKTFWPLSNLNQSVNKTGIFLSSLCLGGNLQIMHPWIKYVISCALWSLYFITWWPLSAYIYVYMCMCVHNYQSWLHLLNNTPNIPAWMIHHGPVEAFQWAGHHRGRLGFIGPTALPTQPSRTATKSLCISLFCVLTCLWLVFLVTHIAIR